jgi:SAM-dependent methyltransferase
VDAGSRPPGYEIGYFADSYLAVREARVRFLRAMLDDLAVGDVVVDVGAGAGFALDAIQRPGSFLVGVDPSEAATRLIRDAGYRSVRAAGSALPLASGCSSAVLLLDVLAHVGSPRRTLAEAARVLRPGGTLVIKTPNRPRWVYRLAARLPARAAASLTHLPRQLHAATPQGLERALEDLSIDVVRSVPSKEPLKLRDRWRAGARMGLFVDTAVGLMVGRPSWIVWGRKR